MNLNLNLHKKKIVFFLVLALAICAFVFRQDIFDLLNYLEMVRYSMPIQVAIVLILIKIISAPIGFPGSPLTILTGALFGLWYGTLIALIGNTLGALAAFLLSRYVFGDYVQNRLLPKYNKLKDYSVRLESRPLVTVIALRLVPLFPFNSLNFILGVTNLSVRNYFIGSFFGMIPGSFAYVFLGGSIKLLSPLNITLAIIGLITLVYIGKYYEKKF